MDELRHEPLGRRDLSFRAFPGHRGSLLLLHGMLASHHYFSAAVHGAFAPWRTLFPDLLGFGDSAKPEVAFTLEDHLACLRDLVEAEGSPPPLVIGGHSLGCLIATALAARLPKGRVAGMVFLNYPRFTSPSGLHETLRNGSAHYRQATDSLGNPGHDSLLALSGEAVQTFAGLLPPLLQEEARRTSPRALAGTTQHCLFGYRPDQDLDAISDLPMLFLLSGGDEVAPARFILERRDDFPLASWRTFEDAGHHLVHSHTDQVVKEIQDFLARISRPAS